MGGYVPKRERPKFRLTIIQPGEEVWSKEVPADGFGVIAAAIHILNALLTGGELILKPNRVLAKAEMEELEELAGKRGSDI